MYSMTEGLGEISSKTACGCNFNPADKTKYTNYLTLFFYVGELLRNSAESKTGHSHSATQKLYSVSEVPCSAAKGTGTPEGHTYTSR